MENKTKPADDFKTRKVLWKMSLYGTILVIIIAVIRLILKGN